MANSSIVSEIKKKVITEIIKDEGIFHAINSPDIQNPKNADQLVNTHLFRYNQNPNTMNKAITFLTFQVHLLKPYMNNTLIKAQLEIYIISVSV